LSLCAADYGMEQRVEGQNPRGNSQNLLRILGLVTVFGPSVRRKYSDTISPTPQTAIEERRTQLARLEPTTIDERDGEYVRDVARV
jgi:hypothetical protein